MNKTSVNWMSAIITASFEIKSAILIACTGGKRRAIDATKNVNIPERNQVFSVVTQAS